jgi:hypothetical protein
MPFNKNRLPIKHIHVWISDFSMDQQGHIDCLHPFQQRRNQNQIAHTIR